MLVFYGCKLFYLTIFESTESLCIIVLQFSTTISFSMETCFHVDVVFSTELTKDPALYGELGNFSHLACDIFVSINLLVD